MSSETIKQLEYKLESGVQIFSAQEVVKLFNVYRIQKALISKMERDHEELKFRNDDLYRQVQIASQRLGFMPSNPMQFKGEK